METPPPLPPALPTSPRYAGFWIRFVASVIDTVFLSVLLLPLLWAFYGDQLRTMMTSVANLNLEQMANIKSGPADLLVDVGLALIVITLWRLVRGTPGKLLLGLRVIDERTGANLSWAQSVVRYLGYFVSLLPLGLGFFWAAFDPRKQGFHDRMARSLVVHAK
ncbi:MAG: RDD family protein [Verrucomicrobiota bacterium]|nr:RDD family protein [Verrucomicrobiota bacterium]